MRKPKQPGSAPHTHGWALGVQGQLMLFLCGITVLTLGLVWGLITYGLQPMYNRNIQKRLERESSVIAGMIDSAGGQISSRDYGSLTLQNETFWSNLKTALENGVINVDNCCIDISDNTCRSVQFLEGLYPCILHNSMATFGDNMTVYTPDTRTAILARHALYNEGSLYKIIESGGNRQMLVGCLTKDGSYGVIVSASLAQIETAAEVMRSVLIPVAIFLIALNLLVAALFSRWFTRPMRQLSEGAREIADGNYDVQVPVVRNDELGLLGREFNHMAQEVKRSAQLEKDILANVSHDLRTPLTNISGSASILMQKECPLDDAAKERLYTGIYDDTNWLISMTENLLAATHLEADKGALPMEPQLLEDIFQSAATQLDRRAREHNISIVLQDPMLMANINAKLILRVIINIMNNAIQYTPNGSHIVLSGERKGDMVEVSISDDGPGIPDEAKKHLFDLFYTAEQGRSDCQRGLGLGLNLCRSIIAQHNGQITVSDNRPSGTVFRFTLPAVDRRGLE